MDQKKKNVHQNPGSLGRSTEQVQLLSMRRPTARSLDSIKDVILMYSSKESSICIRLSFVFFLNI